jgi:hypothetical protein
MDLHDQKVIEQFKSQYFAKLGRKGSKARAQALTAAQRVAIATKASKAAAKARMAK